MKIITALETHGFDVKCTNMGIYVKLDWVGITDKLLEFYVLKGCPEQVRARLRKSSSNINTGFENNAFYTETDLEYIRNLLEESMSGTAKIGRFFYYGYRKDAHYYYAHIDMLEGSEDVFIRQKVLEKILYELKNVDSKVFRQGLDMLGLSRSSIVRLALTRIFRHATDPEEIMVVVSREAFKIVNAEEWKTLRDLINSNRIKFMGNIIYILWEEVSRLYMKKAWEELYK
ncbi:MAG: hypothetical protein R6U27_05065 [Desulfobacterales bacterium]